MLPLILVQADALLRLRPREPGGDLLPGPRGPAPDGRMGAHGLDGQSAILSGHPQESLYAGLMIIATVVAFNLLGNRLATRHEAGPPVTSSSSTTWPSTCSSQGEMRPVHPRHVTLSLEGEAVGLVGESGAGKSMAARAIIRLLPRGRVDRRRDPASTGRSMLGMDRAALRHYRAHDVAMIFQDPRAHINPGAHHRRLPHRGPDDHGDIPRRGDRCVIRPVAGGRHCRSRPAGCVSTRTSSRGVSSSGS